MLLFCIAFRRSGETSKSQNSGNAISITLEKIENLNLSLKLPDIEGAIIIEISGFIDTFNSDFFHNQLSRVIDAEYRHIILDVSATIFMSGTSIGAFTALWKKIKGKDGTLIVLGMPPKIYEVFHLLGFTSFFHFCNTLDAALDILNSLPPPG